MRERTEKLWEDSSNSLFGLAKNLGAISGILLVGGLAGFSANRRRTIHNNLMLAGATRRQIFGLEFRASALSLIPGAILGSAMLSELVVGAANDQTLNLGAELTPSNILAGLSATLAGGGLATAAAAFSSARKANPRGEV